MSADGQEDRLMGMECRRRWGKYGGKSGGKGAGREGAGGEGAGMGRKAGGRRKAGGG